MKLMRTVIAAAALGLSACGMPAGADSYGGYPASGLVSYWSFDETTGPALDPIGNNHGTLGANATRVPTMLGGRAIAFHNASSSGVSVGDGNGSFVVTTGITLSAVIKPDWSGNPFDYDEIFRKEDPAGRLMLLSFQYEIGAQGRVLSFGLNVGGAYQELDMPLDGLYGRPTFASLKDGRYHRVVATYDAATGRKAIYIDGTLRYYYDYAPGLLITGGLDNNVPAVIGNHTYGSEPFAGVIDEVAYYNRALSTSEIAALPYVTGALAPAASALQLWLKSDAGVTAANGASGAVWFWQDQSGYEHHALQNDPGAQPGLFQAAVYGRPAVRFDGASDYMPLLGQVLHSQRYTIFAVANDTRPAGDYTYHFREIFSNWAPWNMLPSVFMGTTITSGQVRGRMSDEVGGATDPLRTQLGVGLIASPSRHFIMTGISSNTDVSLYLNTTLMGNKGAAPSARNLTTPYYLGTQRGTWDGEFWHGDIAEILVYDRVLSFEEMNSTYAYLEQKYGAADTTPPSTSASVNPESNAAGWNNTTVTVTLTSADNPGGTGVRSISYSLDGSASEPYSNSISLTTDGVHIIRFRSDDWAGNVEAEKQVAVNIDATAPALAYTGERTYGVEEVVNVTYTASDTLSGIDAALTSGDQVSGVDAYTLPLNQEITLSATAYDRAGNSTIATARIRVALTYDGLCALVRRWVTSTDVQNGLCDKLRAAEAANARGNTRARDNALDAFCNQVRAQSGKSIPVDKAEHLIRLANALKN